MRMRRRLMMSCESNLEDNFESACIGQQQLCGTLAHHGEWGAVDPLPATVDTRRTLPGCQLGIATCVPQ